MKEPVRPWPPSEWSYKATTNNKYIYYHKDKLRGDDDYEDELDDEEPSEKDKELAQLPKKEPHKLTLAWLLTQLPEGVKPEDIKMEFGYNASSMAFEDHYVGFYYEVKIPARMKQYKIDKAKYEADLAQYEKDMVAYGEWKREEEIRKTEEKLKQLRGG